MKKMTGEEFKKLIERNASWCKNLKEPIEVTTYVELGGSKITHLSPLLTFSGKDEIGWSASFFYCKNLKVATGTFKGFVNFTKSEIETIKDLTIREADVTSEKAYFYDCPITYVPKKYRTKKFKFNDSVKENSIRKDAINKIKSEANNLEL